MNFMLVKISPNSWNILSTSWMQPRKAMGAPHVALSPVPVLGSVTGGAGRTLQFKRSFGLQPYGRKYLLSCLGPRPTAPHTERTAQPLTARSFHWLPIHFCLNINRTSRWSWTQHILHNISSGLKIRQLRSEAAHESVKLSEPVGII